MKIQDGGLCHLKLAPGLSASKNELYIRCAVINLWYPVQTVLVLATSYIRRRLHLCRLISSDLGSVIENLFITVQYRFIKHGPEAGGWTPPTSPRQLMTDNNTAHPWIRTVISAAHPHYSAAITWPELSFSAIFETTFYLEHTLPNALTSVDWN